MVCHLRLKGIKHRLFTFSEHVINLLLKKKYENSLEKKCNRPKVSRTEFFLIKKEEMNCLPVSYAGNINRKSERVKYDLVFRGFGKCIPNKTGKNKQERDIFFSTY